MDILQVLTLFLIGGLCMDGCRVMSAFSIAEVGLAELRSLFTKVKIVDLGFNGVPDMQEQLSIY